MQGNILYIFFIFGLILDFHRTRQCGSGSSPAPPPKLIEVKKVINDTELINGSSNLDFLVKFEEHSRRHRYDLSFHEFLGCKGKYHELKGKVMHGLCSYCVEMHPRKNNVYWRCMDKCFTGFKTDNCRRAYEELCNEEITHLGRFIEELSGRKVNH